MTITSPATMSLELAHEQLPGLGWFGSAWSDRLRVKVGHTVSEILLESPSARLDLKGVRVTRPPEDEGVGFHVNVSGTQSELNVPDLFALRPIRARGEMHSWWRVRFDSPVRVNNLLVFNTASWRNAEMTISAVSESGGLLTLRDPSGRRHLAATLAALARYVSVDLAFRKLDTPVEAEAWRIEVLSELVTALRAGAQRPSIDDWLLLSALLPLTRTDDAPSEPSDDEYFLLAYSLMLQVALLPTSRSDWKAMRYLVDTRRGLERMDALFDECASLLKTRKRGLTRHGLTPKGELQALAGALGLLVRRLREDMSSLRLTPLLAYGSLLGQVREGHLLSHDDDVDLMVCLTAGSEEEFNHARAELADSLRDMGWDVRPNGRFWNMHVSRGDMEGDLDLFAVRVTGDTAYTHMDRMEVRELPAAVLRVGDVVNVDGIEVNRPAEPERFLQARYGQDWRTPDPYHDWLWPLAD